MRVETVVTAPVPAMLNHHVFAVIGMASRRIYVNDLAVCNRADFIHRFITRVAMETANVDPFVKSSKDHPDRRLNRIAHKTVLTALPGRRFHALVNPLD